LIGEKIVGGGKKKKTKEINKTIYITANLEGARMFDMLMTSRVKLPVYLYVSVWSAWQHVLAVVRSGHKQTGNGTRVALLTLPTAFCACIYSVW
jgi:hypothetical protein